MTAPADFVRTSDFARIALDLMADPTPAADDEPMPYQPHEPVADDDSALPPMQYDAVVAVLGYDPLHGCPEHRDRCAGAECCCVEAHREAS